MIVTIAEQSDIEAGVVQKGVSTAEFTKTAGQRVFSHIPSRCDIGSSVECFSQTDNSLRRIDVAVVSKILSKRPATGHKGDFGRLLLTVGSGRYRGAAVLAALGAYYTGAGVVTVASTEKVLAAVAAHLPEAVLFDTELFESEYAGQLARSDACLIGCGLTESKASADIFKRTVSLAECPLVIDADGLNLLSKNPLVLEHRKGGTILTPHIGEFSRMTALSTEEILSNRIKYAKEYAMSKNVTLILKSENTVAALPDGRIYVNTAGNSGLAKAGSGDLLSGVITALLGMGKTAEDAALAGVYLHSLAADIAAKHRDTHSLTAGFIAGFISDAYRYIFSKTPEK